MKAKEWRALDHCDDNRRDEETATVTQDADQINETIQTSEEWIIIKDSEDVDVITTDTQAAASLQLGLQVALGIVINITVGDTTRAEQIMQDFNQMFRTRQRNRQKTIVEKSKHVEIETIDTDVAINIQLLIQVLVAVVASLDIL